MTPISRRTMLTQLGAAAGALWTAGARAQTPTTTDRPPNIVLIFADDLGYGDLSCYGAEKIDTPRLDAMARDGMRFTDFYCSAAVCTPSRAGLLTGRYHVRSGMNRVLFPFSNTGLPESEVTVAELLQAQGYATACIGKWHLGHKEPYLPRRHGFDYYYGIPYSNDMDVERRNDPPLPLMRNEEIVEQPANQDTLTKRYTEEAVQFIEQHQDEPFFVYLPHTMPHVPLHVSERFRGSSEGGLYGDVIEEMDWSTGQILDALEANNLASNTLVIFTSDNGPWLAKGDRGGSAGKLREGKNTTFEGGVRVPCIAWWPGTVPANTIEHTPAITLDLLPTFVELAGGKLPANRTIDGHDLSALLTGEGSRKDEPLYFFSAGNLEAIRDGQWKLKRPMKARIYGKKIEHGQLLFNLEDDPEESNNLAEKHPEIVRELEAKMDAFEKSLGDLPPTRF